ncbi:MAG: permease prefix domain 1-containing protein [Candidatus Limnocylindrales bacterium]|nr:permease prefix domain 1-containing protein [Candidatus Limnocylindrales bacterium]
MPEPTMHDRDAFLQRIADRLPFDEAERLDILRELAVHLSDSTARLEADGLTPDAAERTALERLGPPDRLADALTEARRSPRRLLAAAGAGTYAALGGALYGYLFALLVVMVVSFATVALAAALHLFGGSWGSLLDTTTTTVAALAAGAYVAGRMLTTTVAVRAGYHIELARRVTALVGGALVLGYALAGWSGSLTWPEVGLLLSLPVWFVVGAWRATGTPFPSRRWRLGVIGLTVILVPAALLLGMGQSGSASGGAFYPAGVERIGLRRPAAIEAAVQGGGGLSPSGPVWVTIDDPSLLTGWSGFRVEAWRGITHGEEDFGPGWTVDPRAEAPFSIGAANLQVGPSSFSVGTMEVPIAEGSAVVRGTISVDNTPDVTLAWVAITGLAPDGSRYILHGPDFISTSFNGTVIDWLTAVFAGR